MTKFIWMKIPILLSSTMLVNFSVSCSQQETSAMVYKGNKEMFLDTNYKPALYDGMKENLANNPSYVVHNIRSIISNDLLRDTIYLFIWNEVIGTNRTPSENYKLVDLEYQFTNVNVTKTLSGSFYCDFSLTIKYSILKNQQPVYYKSTWTSQRDDGILTSKQTLVGYADAEFTIEQQLQNSMDYENIGPNWGVWTLFYEYYKTINPSK